MITVMIQRHRRTSAGAKSTDEVNSLEGVMNILGAAVASLIKGDCYSLSILIERKED